MGRNTRKIFGGLMVLATVGFLSRGSICYTDLCGHEHGHQMAEASSPHPCHGHHHQDPDQSDRGDTISECCPVPVDLKTPVLSLDFQLIPVPFFSPSISLEPVVLDLDGQALWIPDSGGPPPLSPRDRLLLKQSFLI